MTWELFCNLSNIAPRYRNSDVKDFESLYPEAFQFGKNWISRPKSIIITGNTGSGKTRFSFSLAKQAITKYGIEQTLWISSKKLDDKLLQAIRLDGDSSSILNDVSTITFLFLDDFGMDRSGERTERDYYEIIDRRWSHGLPTIITTNLSFDAIQKIYGSRIFSRLKSFTWMEMEGQDQRENDAEQEILIYGYHHTGHTKIMR